MTSPLRPRTCSALRASALAVTLLLLAGHARAMCDVIPSPTDFFRGALGSITTPALLPGFSVDVIVRSVVCDQDTRSAAPDFVLPATGTVASAADLSVAIVFEPVEQTAPRNGVWLRESCAGVGPIAIPGPGAAGEVFCIDGADALYEVVSVDLGDGTMQDRLRFTFPDTDAQVAPAGDGLGLAGPATVAVLLAAEDFPVDLGTQDCADFQDDLVACIDLLFKRDSTCNTTAADVEPSVVNVTAFPTPNVFTDFCVTNPDDPDSPCTLAPGAPAPPILFSANLEGDILVPMDYAGALVRIAGEPFPQLVTGALEVSGSTIMMPGPTFVESRAPNWALLPPLFEPVTNAEVLGQLFGSVDARIGIHVLKRRGAMFQQCDGGSRDDMPCNEDADCPGGACGSGSCTGAPATLCTSDAECAGSGECGPSNFDPADLAAATQGEGCSAIVGVCPDAFPCTTNGAVGLEVVAAGSTDDEAIAVSVNECLEVGEDPVGVTADGDALDNAATLLDRGTFLLQSIGRDDAVGRAETRIRVGPFDFGSATVEGPVLAQLESEFQEGDCEDDSGYEEGFEFSDCDRNENGLVSDDFLRIFQLAEAGSESAIDLMEEPTIADLVSPATLSGVGVQTAEAFLLAAEADPNVSFRPVQISEGLVFFRVDPRDNETHVVTLESRRSDGSEFFSNVNGLRISGRGDKLIFSTFAEFILEDEDSEQDVGGDDDNGEEDVYLRDRTTGLSRRVSTPSCAQQALGQTEGNDRSVEGDVSGDGLWAVFASLASDLVSGDTNEEYDVFLRDLSASCPTEETIRLSVGVGGAESNGDSRRPRISYTGRYVVWDSRASNLVASDPNGSTSDIFFLDRDSNGDGVFDDPAPIERISLGGFDELSEPVVSGEASVAFVAGDSGSSVNVVDAPGGTPEFVLGGDSYKPSISHDGNRIAFISDAAIGEFPPEENPTLYVFDRAEGSFYQAGTARAPRECSIDDPNGPIPSGEISDSGRQLVYATDSSNLIPNGNNGGEDTFLEDLLTGAITRRSANANGEGIFGTTLDPTVSYGGNFVSFRRFSEGTAGFVSGSEEATEESGAFFGVFDTANTELFVFDQRADHVAVSDGRAAIATKGETYKLYRNACSGDLSLNCSEDAECNGAGPCVPVIEDLLFPVVAESEAIGIDESFVCGLRTDLGPDPIASCHRIGDPPSASLDPVPDQSGQNVPGVALQVFGGKLAVKVPQPDGSHVLYTADLASGGPLVPSELVKDFQLGEVACFTFPEAVADDLSDPNCDRDNDGDCKNDIMHVLTDPGDPDAEALSCEVLAVRCPTSACFPEQPFSVDGVACKFVIDENLVGVDDVGTDLNLNGEIELLIGRCAEGGTVLGNPIDPDANDGENPVEASGVGDTDVDQTGLCVNDTSGEQTTPCGDDADCALGESCDPGPFVVTLLTSDRDGDGFPDSQDNCPDDFNPGQENFDAATEGITPVGDACDPFSCGDGQVQEAEECDLGTQNGAPGSGCSAQCGVQQVCPCFTMQELMAQPVRQCLVFNAFGYARYDASPFLYADSSPSFCRFQDPPVYRFQGTTAAEAAACQQVIQGAVAAQGGSCLVF